MPNSSKLKTFNLIAEFIKDQDRKSIPRITIELIYLLFLYGEIPQHYFSRYLFKKGKENLKNYLPNKFLYKIKSFFNEEDVREILENKLYFDLFYRQFSFSLPTILMYNHRNMFVVGANSFEVNNTDEFRAALMGILSGLDGDSIFIKKTYWSYEGDGIYKITLNDLTVNHYNIDHLYSEVIKTGYLFQKTIKQHLALEQLNSSCLNTLRLDTFIDSDGCIDVISGYLKTNIKNHFIDNEKSGGCEIPIELTTGRLQKFGYLTIKYNGVKLLTEHPFTKTVFENFVIPQVDEAKALVIRAASYMPGLRLVGWDVAIGESGPILVEGNSDYSIPASDLAYGGYRTNPVFQKALKEINYL